MTNENAIKQLKRMKMDKSHTGDEYNAIMTAIKALEQEPKTDWIPVSESLPEKNIKHNTFLVTDSNGNLSISKFYLPLSNSDIDRPYWSGMIDVIAWMPLPEPYKTESEG